MDVVLWLRSLGLGKYEALFRENDVDETVLPTLTAVKELGVASFGHRRKLLDAIAALRNDASGRPPSADAVTMSSAPSARPEDRAERRQVTVMFSDLVGSTALSARMDLEDLREVISAYQKCVAETVQRFGGFVAKYMGDGVLVYCVDVARARSGAPVYGWFTKGFDTRDLKEAKASCVTKPIEPRANTKVANSKFKTARGYTIFRPATSLCLFVLFGYLRLEHASGPDVRNKAIRALLPKPVSCA
jgi:hypothetical protein